MLAALHHLYFGSQLLQIELAAKLLHLALAQGHHNLADLLVPCKDAQRVDEDGGAADLEELFGRRDFLAGGRHARTQPGRGYDNNHLHSMKKYSNFDSARRSGV